MFSDLDAHQLELAQYMSTLSEQAFYAGWMDGLEFALWRLVVDGPFEYGQLTLSSAHRKRLIDLSDACGGWIIFHDQLEVTFVTADEWGQAIQNVPDFTRT